MQAYCSKFGMSDLFNLSWLGDISEQGLGCLGLSGNYKNWKRDMNEQIQLVGREWWI